MNLKMLVKRWFIFMKFMTLYINGNKSILSFHHNLGSVTSDYVLCNHVLNTVSFKKSCKSGILFMFIVFQFYSCDSVILFQIIYLILVKSLYKFIFFSWHFLTNDELVDVVHNTAIYSICYAWLCLLHY